MTTTANTLLPRYLLLLRSSKPHLTFSLLRLLVCTSVRDARARAHTHTHLHTHIISKIPPPHTLIETVLYEKKNNAYERRYDGGEILVTARGEERRIIVPPLAVRTQTGRDQTRAREPRAVFVLSVEDVALWCGCVNRGGGSG